MSKTSIEIVAGQIAEQLTVVEARRVASGDKSVLVSYKVGDLLRNGVEAQLLVTAIEQLCRETVKV